MEYHEQVYRWVAGRGCLFFTHNFLFLAGYNNINLNAGCFYGNLFAPCLEIVSYVLYLPVIWHHICALQVLLLFKLVCAICSSKTCLFWHKTALLLLPQLRGVCECGATNETIYSFIRPSDAQKRIKLTQSGSRLHGHWSPTRYN